MENVVIALYQRLLIREPSEAEIASGLSVLSEGGESALQAQLAATPEAIEIQTVILPIIGLYQGILLRTPEPSGLSFWSEAIETGTHSFTDLIRTFAETQEVQDRFPELGDTVSNEELVNLFYENLLGRVPDAEGFAFWLNVLENDKLTIPDFVASFLGSQEAQDLIGANIVAYYADLTDDGIVQLADNRDSLLPNDQSGDDPVVDDGGDGDVTDGDAGGGGAGGGGGGGGGGPVNNAPTLQAVTGTTYTDTASDDSFDNASGKLQGADSDANTTLTYGITGGTTGGSYKPGEVIYDVSKAGSYGTLYVSSSTGAYLFVPDDPKIEALTSGTQTDDFTVSVSDGSASATQTYRVTVNGDNDKPELTLGSSAHVVGEAGSYRLTTDDDDIAYTDRDDAASAISFTVSNAEHGSVFVERIVEGENTLVKTSSFTYAELDGGKVSFVQDGSEGNGASFQVAVKDDDGATSDAQTFKLDVTQLDLYFGDDKAPDNTGTVIEELKGTEAGTTGTIVGTLKASGEVEYSYAIEGSDETETDALNALFEIKGGVLKLKADKSLDHESQSSYDLTIKATPTGENNSSPVLTENVTVNVKDIDINPTSSPEFVVKITGTYNDLASGDWQRLFDFSEGANGQNGIWLGQVGNSDSLRFEFINPASGNSSSQSVENSNGAISGMTINKDGYSKNYVELTDVIKEDVAQHWIAGFHITNSERNLGKLFLYEDKNGNGEYDNSDGIVAYGYEFTYTPVARTQERIGDSSFDNDSSLNGEVSNIEVLHSSDINWGDILP
ncbi:protein of unknown function [Fulvimarina manganoxydans]|uniref:Cadherin domain-containing protein n=1 Tax=Fulvimarina manganoxydans TaxID=937218 RepID=A0A1W2BEZ5_9HYPH|nr:DUF4214 domain-containing protein [Fulvimarina manganoxydans]SMC70918.1 protein of unknown function [Fulvimarina manganoxydans]